MKKKALIVEDEFLAAQRLTNLISKIDPSVEVVAVIDNSEDAIQFLKNESVDLIFLDVHLGDDISLSIFEAVDVKTPIIFTTAYDQYALKAFKLNSIDYLLKPVKESELKNAIRKWDGQSRKALNFDLDVLKDALKSVTYRERILLSVGQQIRSVGVNSIYCFYADQKYTSALLDEGKTLLASETLEELESALDPRMFFRINRKAIIHFNGIKKLVKYSRSRTVIELKQPVDFDLIVSVDKAHPFLEWLNR